MKNNHDISESTLNVVVNSYKKGVGMSVFSLETIYLLSEYIVSLCCIWSVAVIGSYGLIRWGFTIPISLKKTVKWLSIIIGAFGLFLIGLCIVPYHWESVLTNLIVPRLICAVSLHLFLLSLDRFIRHRHGGQGMIPTRLVVAIIMVYVVSVVAILAVLSTSSEFILRIAAFNSTYIMRGALLSTLFLEIYGGRCKEHKNSADQSCSLDSASQDLNNPLNNSTFNSSTSSYFDRFNQE